MLNTIHNFVEHNSQLSLFFFFTMATGALPRLHEEPPGARGHRRMEDNTNVMLPQRDTYEKDAREPVGSGNFMLVTSQFDKHL